MIAEVPHQGGATWAVLQYVLGFRELGHTVYFVEPVKPEALLPAGASLESSINAAYFRQVAAEFGLENQAALWLVGTEQTAGRAYADLRIIARTADVLVNISGMLRDEALTEHIPSRVYLDLDPAFNQLWHATQNIDMGFGGHNYHVTIGQAIGLPSCTIPTCGLDWIRTLQPVVLKYWPDAGVRHSDFMSTVANWRAYGSIEYGGMFYGQKAHSLRQFIQLPVLSGEKFVLAMAIHPGEQRDLAALKSNGWQLADPGQCADTPGHYQRFIRESKAEFAIAKSGYAVSRCGWFSDRSVCYLASGRPVIAQETGFSAFLPTGEGLFTFSSCDDVMAGIEALRSDWARHSRAARAIAEEYFDSGKVLTALLQGIGLS